MNYSILFRQFPFDHLDALAPVVAQTYGIPDYDARTKIRKGWGFLDRNATEPEARRLVEAIGELAGGAMAIDNDHLRPLPAPNVITAFESVENGLALRMQSTQKPARPIAWSEIGIVAAGRFSEEIILHEAGGDPKKMAGMMLGLGVFMVTGDPRGLFGDRKKKKEQKPVKSTRVITFGRIVTTAGEQFAFSPDHFDFAGLAEKKQMNAAANFQAFLAELAGHSTARLNLGARLVIDNRSLTFANYGGLHDFETELLWMYNAASFERS